MLGLIRRKKTQINNNNQDEMNRERTSLCDSENVFKTRYDTASVLPHPKEKENEKENEKIELNLWSLQTTYNRPICITL